MLQLSIDKIIISYICVKTIWIVNQIFFYKSEIGFCPLNVLHFWQNFSLEVLINFVLTRWKECKTSINVSHAWLDTSVVDTFLSIKSLDYHKHADYGVASSAATRHIRARLGSFQKRKKSKKNVQTRSHWPCPKFER